MSAEKKVFSRLFTEEKTELATQKIELSLVDDFNSRIDKANNERKSASVMYSKVISAMEVAQRHLELAVKDGIKIDEASKEIGVQSPIDLNKVKTKAKEFSKVVNALNNVRIR